MSRIIADKQDIVAIANATRNKTGKNNSLTLQEIATEINSINGGGSGALKTFSVTFPSQCLGGELIYYLGADGQIHSISRSDNNKVTIHVVQNSIICSENMGGLFDENTYLPDPHSHVETISYRGYGAIITGDVEFSYADGAPS